MSAPKVRNTQSSAPETSVGRTPVGAMPSPAPRTQSTIENPEGEAIRQIDVIGNRRIEKSTITSYLTLQPGDVFNGVSVNDSLNQLFSTGFFSDTSYAFENGVLTILVEENPIVNEVAFEGNRRIEDKELRAELKLKSRAVFTKKDLQADVSRILDVYRKGGRFSAFVEPKIITLPQNRVNVVYEIQEGEKTRIAKIFFQGNEFFSDSTLSRQLRTKETRWYRFLSSDDAYDSDRLAFDQELLRRYYINNGFADVRITSATAELNPERDAFYLTFVIDEGPRYTFGNMAVESKIPNIEPGKFEKLLKSSRGDKYNADAIENSIAAITTELGNQGYAFVNIEPEMVRDVDNNIINLTYVVQEGPRVYVDRINITGNVRTLDKVVRREFRVAEGDPFNAERIRRSQQRIRNLDFFEKVDVKNNPGSAPDRVNIDVDVAEKSTGELNFGAGFSTTDGPLANTSITERNLAGTGKFLKLDLTLAGQRQEGRLSFTEPYFLDKEIAAGFDLYRQILDRRSQSSFDSDSKGVVLRSSYAVTEHLSHTVRYQYSDDDISDIRETASRFVKDQAGRNTTSLVGHSLTWDTRDNRQIPTTGYILRFNQDFAGVGGDSRFVRHEVRSAYYIPTISDKWVLRLAARGGHMTGIGKDVRINQRFFLGGDDLRGFEKDGAGPHDKLTGDSLGGNIYYAGTAEFTFPLGLPEELGFSGAVFADAGSLYDVDAEGVEISDNSLLRTSVGAGIGWASPFGPVRIDFGRALTKDDFDRTQLVRFNFGTRF